MVMKADGRRAPSKGRIGLALAGGGPIGAVYEIGALWALHEALDGLDFTDLTSYVGVSAGGFVAACLANGIAPRQLVRMLFRREPGEVAFRPGAFFTPAYGEWARRALSVPGLVAGTALRCVGERGERGEERVARAIVRLSRAIPAGLFDNEPIRRYVHQLFSRSGRTDDFRQLRHKLTVVAADLGAAQPIRFGDAPWAHVPISTAVQASTAVPGLYTPVAVDGRQVVDGAVLKTVHASAALEDGVDLLLVLNPLVPVDTTADRRARTAREEDLVAHGLPAILSQAARAALYSRMELGHAHYAHRYPHADVVLVEPGRDEYAMFFANVFSFRSRERICELAYAATIRDLRARADELEPLLARHGVRLRRDVLADPSRDVWEGTGLRPALRPARRPAARPPSAGQRLEHAVTRLEEAALLRRAGGAR